MGQRYKKSAKLKKFRGLFLSKPLFTLLFIAFENGVDGLLGEFLGDETDEPDDRETAHHGDGTTVDRIDGIADEHVHHRKSHTPDKAGPDRGGGNTTPVETQHERSQEGTSQGTPRDTHQLGDERRRIQGDEQGDGDEEHDEHTHHHDLTTLHLL